MKKKHWIPVKISTAFGSPIFGRNKKSLKKVVVISERKSKFWLISKYKVFSIRFWKFHRFVCRLQPTFLNNKISIFNIFNGNHKKGNFGSCVASYFFLTRSLLLFYLLPTVLSIFFLYVPLLYHRFSLQKTSETNETLFHFYDLFSGEGKVIEKIAVKIFFIESMSN